MSNLLDGLKSKLVAELFFNHLHLNKPESVTTVPIYQDLFIR